MGEDIGIKCKKTHFIAPKIWFNIFIPLILEEIRQNSIKQEKSVSFRWQIYFKKIRNLPQIS